MVHLACDAHPRDILPSTPIGPRIDLRIDQGGFMGSGVAFIPVPPDTEMLYNIKLTWDLSASPASTSTIWTNSPTLISSHISPATDLHSYFAVGPLRSYLSPSSDLRGIYWFGYPPFDPLSIGPKFEVLLTHIATFFADKDSTFRIFVRKAIDTSFGGTAQGRSFLLEYDSTFNTDLFHISYTQLFTLLAHETVHAWPQMQCVMDHRLETVLWFDEGIATYYQAVLPYRLGILTYREFVKMSNNYLQAYYTNPVVRMSDEDALKKEFGGFETNRLLYYRGAAYFFTLDAKLRTASRGEKDLTEPILEMVRLRREGKPHMLPQWLGLIKAELGIEAVEDFDAMQRGEKLVIPPTDCLG
jgi:hypothetical protein